VIETYRGRGLWECEIVEHFTIVCYFNRFADATRDFHELIGEGETGGTGGRRARRISRRVSHWNAALAPVSAR